MTETDFQSSSIGLQLSDQHEINNIGILDTTGENSFYEKLNPEQRQNITSDYTELTHNYVNVESSV